MSVIISLPCITTGVSQISSFFLLKGRKEGRRDCNGPLILGYRGPFDTFSMRSAAGKAAVLYANQLRYRKLLEETEEKEEEI